MIEELNVYHSLQQCIELLLSGFICDFVISYTGTSLELHTL